VTAPPPNVLCILSFSFSIFFPQAEKRRAERSARRFFHVRTQDCTVSAAAHGTTKTGSQKAAGCGFFVLLYQF
jgi:hypothetical protein